jgi:hypothetical protein
VSDAKSKVLPCEQACEPKMVSESGMKWMIVDTPNDSLPADEPGVKYDICNFVD